MRRIDLTDMVFLAICGAVVVALALSFMVRS